MRFRQREGGGGKGPTEARLRAPGPTAAGLGLAAWCPTHHGPGLPPKTSVERVLKVRGPSPRSPALALPTCQTRGGGPRPPPRSLTALVPCDNDSKLRDRPFHPKPGRGPAEPATLRSKAPGGRGGRGAGGRVPHVAGRGTAHVGSFPWREPGPGRRALSAIPAIVRRPE